MFIYFFCFKLLLIATKVLVEFAGILCHVFGYLVPCTFVEVIFFF